MDRSSNTTQHRDHEQALPAIAILRRLQRPGARLSFSGVSDGQVKLVEPGRNGAGQGVLLPAARFEAFVASGWLVVEQREDGRSLRLSPEAETRLRRLLALVRGRRANAKSKLVRRAVATQPRHGLHSTAPLALYARRRDLGGQPILTSTQREAGERLAADFHRAQLMPRVTVQWSALALAQDRNARRAGPGAGVEKSDDAAAARQRVHMALDVVGSDMAGVLIDICCFEVGLEQSEKKHSLPQRSGKVVLQMALTRLARHYGIIAPDPKPSAEIRHWGVGDYRPTLDAWKV